MEFRPAHTAWQDVQTKGFRTFLKYHGHVSELFVNARDKQMLLGANSLTLQCRETDAPVRAQVQYFILPNACVGALARTLTIENTGNGVLDLEVLDGLPAIVPHGIGDWHLKCMTQTARAWMETVGGETGVPRYRVRASLEDSARVEPITGFAFGFSCVEEGKRLPVLWDPEAVFRTGYFLCPSAWICADGFAGVDFGTPALPKSVPVFLFRCAAPTESGREENGLYTAGARKNRQRLRETAGRGGIARMVCKKACGSGNNGGYTVCANCMRHGRSPI